MVSGIIVIGVRIICVDFYFIFLFRIVRKVVISEYFRILDISIIVEIRIIGVCINRDFIFSFCKFWFVKKK